jgi:hypothetical protein
MERLRKKEFYLTFYFRILNNTGIFGEIDNFQFTIFDFLTELWA